MLSSSKLYHYNSGLLREETRREAIVLRSFVGVDKSQINQRDIVQCRVEKVDDGTRSVVFTRF